MADISSKNVSIPIAFFKDMVKRVKRFIIDEGRNPNIVYITSHKVDWVSWSRYSAMNTYYNRHPKDKAIPVLKSTVPVKTTPAKTSNAPVETQIYISAPHKDVSDALRHYLGKTTPYYNCTLTFTLYAADSAEFKSPVGYGDMIRVNITGKHHAFGGQVTDYKETSQDGYNHSCLDYTRLLFGKKKLKATQCKVSDLIKELLRQSGMPTNGIQETTTVHDSIIIDTNKTIDIIQQCTNLEANWEFFVNQDGIPILRKIPETTKGYVFFTEQSASDYSLDYDASNIISGIRVYGKDGELFYEHTNPKGVIRYGNIYDIIDDSNIASASEAKIKGDELFKTEGRPVFSGSITIPEILDIYKGEWIIFVPPKWSKQKLKAYYTQEVKIDVGARTTTIQFLDGKPQPPSNWIYTPPNTDSDCSTTVSDSGTNTVCAVAKPSHGIPKGLSYRNYLTCFKAECPRCGKPLKWNPKGVPEGEWTCGNDDDWDAVSGERKWNPSGWTLTKVSGPTPTNAPVGQVKTDATNNTAVCTGKSTSGICANLPSSVTDLQSLYDWFWNNIKYSFYYNNKYTTSQVISLGKGNCYDQSALAVELMACLGITAKTVKLHVGGNCGGYTGGHMHVMVNINGQWRIWDTTCHALSSWHHS